jgi:hypothetical protein
MSLSEEQYERISRRLEGEDISLTGAEREVCQEMLHCEQLLAVAMPADVPGDTLSRVRRRMAAASRLRRWAKRAVSAVVGVAAALVIGAGTLLWTYGPTEPANGNGLAFWLEMAATESSETVEIDVLTRAVEELEADVISADVHPQANQQIEQIEELQRDIDSFWLGGVWQDPLDGQL